MLVRLLTIACIIFFLISCQKDIDVHATVKEEVLKVPDGFPAPEFPEDNLFSEERWAFGKQLFFDVRLSRDESVSCASCHLPAFAFSDTVSLSPGVANAPGKRNAPTLANVAYHPYFTREGGVPTLEMQVLVPVQEHNEFDFSLPEIVDRLSSDQDYQDQSMQTYNRELDPFVVTRAIATFERSLLSGNSKYDQYKNNGAKLNELETKGMELFFSEKANCTGCHGGFNFTDYSFENNGLYTEYADSGRYRLTGKEEDVALFKVPSLRNVGVSGPYMHDGSVGELQEVIEHYNAGGKGHYHQSELVKPLNLSEEEKESLLAFLHTLTDTEFLTNKKFR